jgi:hypothetical protein
MSAAPRPTRRAVDDLGAERRMPPRRGVAGGDDVEVAVPRERGPVASPEPRDHARAPLLATDDLGAAAEVLEDLHGDRGNGVLGATRVLARGRDEPAREPQDLVPVHSLDDRRNDRLLYHGGECTGATCARA